MANRKWELRFFTIPQWQQEQDYLRERHLEGWRFVSVSLPGIYTFERCEPEDVIYQLDYNADGSSQTADYLQIFRDCGWEYLQDYTGYSYFRKPAAQMNGKEEIFCDDESRLEMMKRVFRGRIIPLLALFFLFILPNLILYILFPDRPLGGLGLAFFLLFLLYLANFAGFGYQYWKYWKNVRK